MSPQDRHDETFVGRAEELSFLTKLTSGRLPSVTFISGIGGMGKSRLLEAFASQRRARGATAVLIDCSFVEPTERGFIQELGRAVGGEFTTCAEASSRLAGLGDVVLVFDDVESIRLLDTWLRRSFVPAMPPNVHVVFGGRTPPISAWLQMPWRGPFHTLELGPLAEADALALLQRSGIDAGRATRVNRVARGHPLALTLAAITLERATDPELEELAFHRIVDELARRHLSEIDDPTTRRAVEAASVLRRVTAPLLAAMLPDVAPGDVYERLRVMPLMRLSQDGLHLHDAVRDAIAAELRSSDPDKYLSLRRACWSRLIRELRTAPQSELWRHTADLIYLLENPAVREAFFPSGAQSFAVEPARDGDETAVLAITEKHDGAIAAHNTANWWKTAKDAFHVVRDRDGKVAGYYVLFSSKHIGCRDVFEDPIMAQWGAHLASQPVVEHENVFFLRRWLSRSEGESPSAVQAACWLDVKRSYLAHRPHLRRVYLSVRNVEPYAAAATELGFSVLSDCSMGTAADSYTTAVLDFGPASVDGWFERLVARELGIATSSILDLGAREMIAGSHRVALTRREFDTLYYLIQRSGDVVGREDILNDVWGDNADVGSNVVDVTIRSLRKKLKERSSLIETVSGIGYRVSGDHATQAL
jgi:hypothetical protein